ncbi:lignostilbene-alpha,beta-dioxygenase isozyme III [Colletotrichum spaethianum]|uniref:Lignostilbene-alpha,beta-dioxygenase isozyme III n=1 Tax=Colletotrichum spaethianum TaxID=700344 RepID=A0AA37L5S0_9PEZI|nr:lignostilbene-alpha,beta-dioxygenase isozyme III [Colletotrichum spaethianum]GKT40680.1 lignostilbene-alpha,beta-dioxygenase isozyme III [Colletotrichum spaethianum]
MAVPFPESPFLSGFEAPCRYEGQVRDLVVHGEIPKSISGTFFRVMPDPFLSPAYYKNGSHFIPFDGDGNVSAFRIHNGHVDYQQSYVQTERLQMERAARTCLWGVYRNPFTNHPCAKAAIESTANTNVVYFNGQLLALKESSLPYAMDPNSLATKGYYDFEGQVKSRSFTAHPKLDPKTGELVCWGYEAKGNATTDCCYFALGSDGKKTEECWFNAPYCGFIHDAAITDDYLILMQIPMVCEMERLEAHETHWIYDYNLPMVFGVIPRRGADPKKVHWFKWKNAFGTHTANATQVTGPNGDVSIRLDTVLCYGNALGFFPSRNQPTDFNPENIKVSLARFTIAVSAPESSELPQLADPTVIFDQLCEFPRIDDRFVSTDVKWVYCATMIPDLEMEANAKSLVGMAGLNGLAKVDTKTGKAELCSVGSSSLVQEPVFIPRSKDAEEGDGYLVGLVNRMDKMVSDLVVVDTAKFSDGPVAVVNLPLRLRQGLHGNWVDASELPVKDLMGFK